MKVKGSKSERHVIIIGGKKDAYNGGHDINKNLGKKLSALYMSMSDKGSNKNHKILIVLM